VEFVAVCSRRVRDASLHRDCVPAIAGKVIDRRSIFRGETLLPCRVLEAFSCWVAASAYARVSRILAFATKVATHTSAVTSCISGVADADHAPAVE